MREIATVAINGRFLTQPITGVQRFALELTKALDRKVAAGEVPACLEKTKWRLIVPRRGSIDIPFKSIEIDRFGSAGGHLWEQTALAYRSRHDRLICFGGSGPVLHPRQIVVIHDATIFRHPASFGRSYRVLHTVLGSVLTRTATIATISKFSRQELDAVFGVPEAKIAIIRNAVDHFAAVEPDETIFQRLGLDDNGFFLIVGTLKPNKNLEFAVRAFLTLDDSRNLVVVGGMDPNVFKAHAPAGDPRIIYTGRLDDREIVALQRHATAFVFPSLYEGFGIPPLEAMSQGCAVLAADIPPVREACGDSALYFDPTNLDELSGAMRRVGADATLRADLAAKGRTNVTRFSWDQSAADLLAVLAAA